MFHRFGQVVEPMPLLVNWAALDEDLVSPDFVHRCGSGLGPIDDDESSVRDRQAAGDEIRP